MGHLYRRGYSADIACGSLPHVLREGEKPSPSVDIKGLLPETTPEWHLEYTNRGSRQSWSQLSTTRIGPFDTTFEAQFRN
jgi:hypothetical protein